MDKRSISYSILDLAIVPKGSSTKQTIENAVVLAQKAESFGYKRIWFAEHHNSAAIASSAPQMLIGRVAQETKIIRVGSGGIMLPNHSPLIISEQFGTLGTMYPNRIDLGLGRAPGTDQETAHAIKPGFYQATQSFPNDIDQIQNYFSLENRSSKVRAPIAEGVEVPIYILGSSTDSAHLAAKKGLPYAFASHFATAHLFNALGIYRAEFKPSEELEKPYTIAGVNVFIAETDDEAQRMGALIEDLTVLARFDAGRAELGSESIDFALLASSLQRRIQPQADAKRIRLEVNVPSGLPPVRASLNHLTVVFRNLLDNAIKYTPDGGSITWTARAENDCICSVIRDTGGGVEPEQIPLLFERFYRVDKARSRDIPGSGLGLAIVKSIIEAYGGTIRIDSAGKDQGMAVTVWWKGQANGL